MGSSPERGTIIDDHELVLRTKRGDRSAFEILVSRYQDRAYNVAYQNGVLVIVISASAP